MFLFFLLKKVFQGGIMTSLEFAVELLFMYETATPVVPVIRQKITIALQWNALINKRSWLSSALWRIVALWWQLQVTSAQLYRSLHS